MNCFSHLSLKPIHTDIMNFIHSKKQLITSKVLLLLLLLGSISISSFAKVKLPAIFSNHMVLQQNAKVNIWGWAKSGAKITLMPSWDKQKITGITGQDRKWKIQISTPGAGGPYTLKISDGEELQINDILIGEVWLCSGQSNMTMPVKGFPNDPVKGSAEEIMNVKPLMIRVFDVARSTKFGPQDSLKGSWKEVSSENVANFSATAWFFGKTIHEKLRIPVGLITSSWGGSNIETWMSKETLGAFPEVKLPQASDTLKVPNQTPTVLFNNMIHPFIGYNIKGSIWYQGESNRVKPTQYLALFTAMVKDWRSSWGVGEFPFYYLQLAPFNYGKGLSSAYLREAQTKALKQVPNCGMAILLDAGEEKNIHPSDKKAAGVRLGYLALVKTYGVKGISATGPIYKSMKITAPSVQLTFDYAENGLTSWGKELDLFEIAGADRKFYPAIATINKYGIVVSNLTQVPNPVAVRYAFKDFVIGQLFNNEGLPASSFRTDDWPIE